MSGWIGAKIDSAPLTPSAATITLLPIGQPIARYAAKLPGANVWPVDPRVIVGASLLRSPRDTDASRSWDGQPPEGRHPHKRRLIRPGRGGMAERPTSRTWIHYVPVVRPITVRAPERGPVRFIAAAVEQHSPWLRSTA